MSDRAQTAFHEAGHAVLAFITGVIEIDGPIVTSDVNQAEVPLRVDRSRCMARAEQFGGVEFVDHKFEQAIISAAGSEAQRKYMRLEGIEIDEAALFQGAHGDVKRVQELLGPGRWNEVCSVASAYLEKPAIWKVVHTLALAILRIDRPLTANEATDVIENACCEYDVSTIQVLSAAPSWPGI